MSGRGSQQQHSLPKNTSAEKKVTFSPETLLPQKIGATEESVITPSSSSFGFSYAKAAAKNSPPSKKELRKRQATALKMLQIPTKPLEFKVVRVMINDSRPLKNLHGQKRDKLVRQIATEAGIAKYTALTSTIGNSILEFYVPAGTYDQAITRFNSFGLRILEKFDPAARPSYGTQSAEACQKATVNRLAHLCLAAKVVNLQDTILSGFFDEVKIAVLIKVREVTKNPLKTLGRQTTDVMEMGETADLSHDH